MFPEEGSLGFRPGDVLASLPRPRSEDRKQNLPQTIRHIDLTDTKNSWYTQRLEVIVQATNRMNFER
jgi:hypothetical protein